MEWPAIRCDQGGHVSWRRPEGIYTSVQHEHHYFVFYHQIHGALIGSLVSPSIANAKREDFEEQALATAPNLPHA